MDFVNLIEMFGLPTAILIGFTGLVLTDKFRTGTSVDKQLKSKEEAFQKERDGWAIERDEAHGQVAYRETLRAEERTRSDRLEMTLASTTTTLRDMTEVLKDVEREIVRSGPREH